ncbi:MAG: hypothetical protein M3N33_07110 [Actinomycetota bacterium]|nr:hypothetical protein [Actinomycetota bacterium]
MSEERQPVHPQEPAEGGDEDVQAPGADKPSDTSNPGTADEASEEKRSAHPQEPVEGGEDQVDE